MHTLCKHMLCCLEDHSISIHEKPGLSFCSQPNLAALSPSALPSAGLSAACLEVNSFMIPLSVLPIFKWLIFPLWQLLAQAPPQPPLSLFRHHRGHHQDNNPRLLPDMRYQIRIDFTKCAATTKRHIWSRWSEIDIPFSEASGSVTNQPAAHTWKAAK